MLPAERWGITP